MAPLGSWRWSPTHVLFRTVWQLILLSAALAAVVSGGLGLTNGRLSIRFGNSSTGFALEQLQPAAGAAAALGNLLSKPHPPWWTATLVLPGNATAVITSASPCHSHAHTHTVAADDGSQTLALHWAAVSVSDSAAVLADVLANWTLQASAHTAELSAFSVVPAADSGTDFALWSLQFSLRIALAETDTLFVPFLYGLAFDDPGRSLYSSPMANGWDGAYPSSLATMQIMAHAKRAATTSSGTESALLYFAAHDPAAGSKTLSWTVDTTLASSPHPMGQSGRTATMALYYTPPGASVALSGGGHGFQLSFPWVLGALPGDSWWEATNEYRSWALRKNASWLSAGPLRRRVDVPLWAQAPAVASEAGGLETAAAASGSVDFWVVCTSLDMTSPHASLVREPFAGLIRNVNIELPVALDDADMMSACVCACACLCYSNITLLSDQNANHKPNVMQTRMPTLRRKLGLVGLLGVHW